MDKGQKAKTISDLRRRNVLESIKDLGTGVGQSLKTDLLEKTSQEFLKEMFGVPEKKQYSGDITPGESLDLTELLSGKSEENERLKGQIRIERSLHEEEKLFVQEKSDQLKVQLHALMQEVLALAKTTQSLGEEVEMVSIQAPANPGIYHIVFFEKILAFLRSFRQKIDQAGLWLQSSNKRAEKKNYWSMYKKKGSSFLLAPDHYLQRSAG